VIGTASGQNSTPKIPRFEDYKARRVFRGQSVAPVFADLGQYSGSLLRCFQREPSEYANEPANFAGHYVLDQCTCGSGCHLLFMWDALDGKLFYREFFFGSVNIGPFDVRSMSPVVEYPGESYRLDSTLLVVEGCFAETCDCAKHYYQWTGDRFKLIRSEDVSKPSHCAR
jgi:hypothetical protein